MALSKTLGPACVSDKLVDTDLAAPGIQPECQIADQYVNDQGTTVRSALPACAVNNDTPPCWTLAPDVERCAGPFLSLSVHRSPASLPDGLVTSLSCAACVPGAASPGCP
jgi:hypothetical protein